MADIKQHAVMVRDLVTLHKEHIHSADKDIKNNQDICASCFEDMPKPRTADTAKSTTHLPSHQK